MVKTGDSMLIGHQGVTPRSELPEIQLAVTKGNATCICYERILSMFSLLILLCPIRLNYSGKEGMIIIINGISLILFTVMTIVFLFIKHK